MNLAHLVDQLAPTIHAHAQDPTTPHELSPAIVEALHTTGILRSLLPIQFGGIAATLPEFLEQVGRCAQWDASTAWCLCQGSVIATVSGWLPIAGAQRLWAQECVAIANGPPISGEAQWQSGELKVSGHWGFSSGFHHASHLTGAIRIRSTDSTPDEWAMVFLPKAQAQVIDNWHTSGLQRTGSVQFKVKDLRVPVDRVARTSAAPKVAAPLFALPTGQVFALGFASLALGVARAGLDDVLALVQTKSPAMINQGLVGDADTQRLLGHTVARWQAATSLIRQTATDAWAAAQTLPSDRVAVSDQVKVTMRTAGSYGLREAGAIMQNLWQLAGTSGIYTDHPLHQRYQDMQVITQHAQGRESHYAWIGRYLMTGNYEPGPLN